MNQIAVQSKALANSKPMTKGEVFRVLNSKISLNGYRLPDHIYRADLIPEDVLEFSPKDRQLHLDAASMIVSFEHGYPAINQNQPMWEQLPSETDDAYGAYLAFLELPEKSNSDNPIRLLPIISTLTKRSLSEITDWCHMFYWHWRARAYDLFLVACHRKQREQRIMSIEGQHFKMAENMLNKVINIATRKLDKEIVDLEDPDVDTETKLKDLVDMSMKLVQIQRISVGLSANGNDKLTLEMNGPRHSTAAETFKHIAVEGSGDDGPSQRSAEMDALLDSPEELSTIQELMIKLHNPSHTLPSWGSGQIIDVNPTESASAGVVVEGDVVTGAEDESDADPA
jgi:hypothetical protein